MYSAHTLAVYSSAYVQHYGDLYTAPTEVKLAVANGLSLANQPAEALKVFTDINWG